MNKRIKEIAIFSGAGTWGDSIIPATMDIEKFAKLLIEESSRAILENNIEQKDDSSEPYYGGWVRGVIDSAHIIRKHWDYKMSEAMIHNKHARDMEYLLNKIEAYRDRMERLEDVLRYAVDNPDFCKETYTEMCRSILNFRW